MLVIYLIVFYKGPIHLLRDCRPVHGPRKGSHCTSSESGTSQHGRQRLREGHSGMYTLQVSHARSG